MSSYPKVCAVILNLEGMPVLEDCLRTLEKADYPALEAVVVHNGPRREGLEAAAKGACSRVSEVVFTGANLGFAAGNNPGIKAALARGAEYVLLLNDDILVAQDFIAPLVGALQADRTAGMAGPRIFYAAEKGRIWFTGARLDRAACSFYSPGSGQEAEVYGHPGVEETAYATACAVLVSRDLIDKTGLLDEEFFIYWEDSDWGLRAAAAGFKSLTVPASRIWHKVSSSAGGDDAPFKRFHKTRGQFVFAARHCGGGLRVLLLRLLRDAAWLVFKSGKPGHFRMAAALLAGAASYFAGGRGPGPAWLRTGRDKF